MTGGECWQRDSNIWMLSQKRHQTAGEIAKFYGMSVSRVRQILRDMRQIDLVSHGYITRIPVFADRLAGLYSWMMKKESCRHHQNSSIRGILECTLRYLPEEAHRPSSWVAWLKQATYDELLDIPGVGMKKVRILIRIQQDLQKNWRIREEQLLLGVERMI